MTYENECVLYKHIWTVLAAVVISIALLGTSSYKITEQRKHEAILKGVNPVVAACAYDGMDRREFVCIEAARIFPTP